MFILHISKYFTFAKYMLLKQKTLDSVDYVYPSHFQIFYICSEIP